MSRSNTKKGLSRVQAVVTAHDAGAAEHLSAYVKKNRGTIRFSCYAAGPAIAMFRKKDVLIRAVSEKISPIEILKQNQSADFLLTGVDWSSDFGLKFIRAAKARGTRTIAFLDHWINYRERFGYPRKDWKNFLPQEVWVADRWAYQIAKNAMPAAVHVKQVRNDFMDEVRRAFDTERKRTRDATALLFLSEPITGDVNSFGDVPRLSFSEYTVFEDICRAAYKNRMHRQLRIRFHPSEKLTKYDAIISRYRNVLRVQKSKEASLAKDLARSQFVIGMDTAALRIAAICGKKVIRYLPDRGYRGTIPSSGITTLRTKMQLDRVFSELGSYTTQITPNK